MTEDKNELMLNEFYLEESLKITEIIKNTDSI